MSKSSLSTFLVTRTVGSFAFKVFAAGISFFSTIVLTRLLGAEGYGAYAYAMAWVGLLAGLSVFGLDNLLIRQVAVYRTREDWGLLRGLLTWSGRAALLGSVGVALCALACLRWFGPTNEITRLTIGIAVLGLPLIVLTRLRQAALQGLERVLTAQLPEGLFLPVLFIALLLALVYGLEVHAEAWHAVLLQLGAYALAFVLGAVLLWRSIPDEVRASSAASAERDWLRATGPLFLAGVFSAVNGQGETLVLGMLAGEHSVGRYAVAYRLAGLLSFVLLAANAVLPPRFARLYEEKDYAGLRHLVVRSAQWLLLASLPLAALFFFAGAWILGIFGEEFTGGRRALVILSLGQLLNVGAGSVGYLLLMTGHAKKVVLGLLIGAVTNVLLASALVPTWGSEGAAVASAVSLLLWNVFMAVAVWKALGFVPTALGSLWKGKE